MTEILDIKKILRPSERRPDWRAFILAMVATPIVLGVGGAVLVIPAFAAILGLPMQLTLGTAAALLAIRYGHYRNGRPGMASFIGYAFLANFFSPVLYTAWALVTGESDIWEGALIYLGFGAIFAPVEGAIFGGLYRLMARRADALAGTDPDIFT